MLGVKIDSGFEMICKPGWMYVNFISRVLIGWYLHGCKNTRCKNQALGIKKTLPEIGNVSGANGLSVFREVKIRI